MLSRKARSNRRIGNARESYRCTSRFGDHYMGTIQYAAAETPALERPIDHTNKETAFAGRTVVVPSSEIGSQWSGKRRTPDAQLSPGCSCERS